MKTSVGQKLALANSSENKVNKIFGIGLSRTGTTSLYYLMKYFGFMAVHYPSSMEEIDEHFFCNDTSITARFAALDRLYPNSKFIYTTRTTQYWVDSCMKRFSLPKRLEEIRNMPNQVKSWYDEADMNIYHRDQLGLATITEEELVKAYHQHDQRVKIYFEERPDDLLTFDITDNSILPLTKLLAFLESLGLVGIPHTNANAELYSPAWKR